MPRFSNKSDMRLDTCHALLQELFRAVVKKYDCAVVEGHRTRRRQNQLFQQGRSQVKWPNSKHNVMPSEAVDVAPWIKDQGIPWKSPNQFHNFAGFVKAKALELGIEIRWGGDWDGDNDVNDQWFNDLAHFELISTKRRNNGV